MIEYLPKNTAGLPLSGYSQLPARGISIPTVERRGYILLPEKPKIPVIRAPEEIIVNIPKNPLINPITGGSGATSGDPLASEVEWVLTNGQAMPPAGTILIAKRGFAYYDNSETPPKRFTVLGKTAEETTKQPGEAVGVYTGVCTIGRSFKPYRPLMLQVRVQLGFDRLGNSVTYDHTFWVNAMDVEYSKIGNATPGIISNTVLGNIPGAGYGTGNGQGTEGKGFTWVLLLGAAFLLLKRKK